MHDCSKEKKHEKSEEKNEIHKAGGGIELNATYIVLGLLLLFSVFQSFQINSLNAMAAEQSVKLNQLNSAPSSQSFSAGNSAQGSQSALPSNLQNLPDMVGGC